MTKLMIRLVSIAVIFSILSAFLSCVCPQGKEGKLKQRIEEFHKKNYTGKLEDANRLCEYLPKNRRNEDQKKAFTDWIQGIIESQETKDFSIKFLEINIEGDIAEVEILITTKYRDLGQEDFKTWQISQIDKWVYEEGNWFFKDSKEKSITGQAKEPNQAMLEHILRFMGKHAIERFGPGRFVIAPMSDSKTNIFHNSLYDCENLLDDNGRLQAVVFNITNYKAKDKSVYLVNQDKEYTILNYETGEHKTFKQWDDIPEMLKPLFEGL